MKRAKRIYILLGILAVICVVTFFVVKHEEKQENIRNSGEVVLEVDVDSVESISWENESESLAFHKEDGWIYDDDTAFPVNEEKINELIEQFEQFSAAFIIEEVTDYSQYGLDDPVCTIEMVAGEKHTILNWETIVLWILSVMFLSVMVTYIWQQAIRWTILMQLSAI